MTRPRQLFRLFTAFAGVLALAVSASGFQQNEILTNNSILKLVADRVPTATITAKIKATPNSFDVSPSALVNLYQNRIPTDVISAMLKAQSRTPTLDNAGVLAMVAARLPSKLILEKIALSPTAFDLSSDGMTALRRSRADASVLTAMEAAGPKGGPPTQAATVASVTAPTNPPNTAGAPTAVTTTEPTATPVARGIGPRTTPVAPEPVSAISIARVGDGETAVVTTGFSFASALDKVQAYFKSRNISYSVGADGSVFTGWFDERSCGPSLLRCANRAIVRVGSAERGTTIAVQVFERSRQAVPNPKPWTENPKTNGRATSETAIAIQTFVR